MALGRDDIEIFEIDRASMVVLLQNLRREINDGAEEMEMVAAERVFREAVSRALVQEAKRLYATANELTAVLRLVTRAGMPKAIEQAEHKPAKRYRPRTRN